MDKTKPKKKVKLTDTNLVTMSLHVEDLVMPLFNSETAVLIGRSVMCYLPTMYSSIGKKAIKIQVKTFQDKNNPDIEINNRQLDIQAKIGKKIHVIGHLEVVQNNQLCLTVDEFSDKEIIPDIHLYVKLRSLITAIGGLEEVIKKASEYQKILNAEIKKIQK